MTGECARVLKQRSMTQPDDRRSGYLLSWRTASGRWCCLLFVELTTILLFEHFQTSSDRTVSR